MFSWLIKNSIDERDTRDVRGSRQSSAKLRAVSATYGNIWFDSKKLSVYILIYNFSENIEKKKVREHDAINYEDRRCKTVF